MYVFHKKICVVEIFVVPLHPQTRKALVNSNQDTNQGGNDCLWIGEEKGTLAQVVEQWTENPCVLGSTPRGTTLEEVFRLLLFFVYIPWELIRHCYRNFAVLLGHRIVLDNFIVLTQQIIYFYTSTQTNIFRELPFSRE